MAGPVSIPLLKKGLMVAGAAGAYAATSLGKIAYDAHQNLKKVRSERQDQKPRSAQGSSELNAKD